MIQRVETLIVGAGVIGSSVAMHLAKMGMSDIRVIDFDLEGTLSSSELNAGGVRATWVQPINIEMSKLTIDYFSTVANEVGYRDCGYLWLHPKERLDAALKARETQIARNWPVEVWDVPELQRKVPFIDKTESIAGALFAPRDGLINPNLLKNHYRSIARSKGVVFDDRTLLREVTYDDFGSSGIRVVAERFESAISDETRLEVYSNQYKGSSRSKVEYRAKQIVNCAGPWAFHVAQILGYKSPAYPLRRQVCIFDCRDLDLTPYGMIVDTSGVYFHPEATNGLSGLAVDEPPGVNYQYDGESFFLEKIWPALYERSSYFERLKHLTGWAGLYEVSPDECAILGEVKLEKTSRENLVFEAHSFSGHGVMHSYSAGLVLAEKMVHGEYQTIDAEPLSGARFEKGRLIKENLII
jgi:sarcosine oxidase subunit beta